MSPVTEPLDRKAAIHALIRVTAFELLEAIKDAGSRYEDRWVPAADIKNTLELNFVAVPRGGNQYGKRGWLFAILARILEDEGYVEHKLVGTRAFFRAL